MYEVSLGGWRSGSLTAGAKRGAWHQRGQACPRQLGCWGAIFRNGYDWEGSPRGRGNLRCLRTFRWRWHVSVRHLSINSSESPRLFNICHPLGTFWALSPTLFQSILAVSLQSNYGDVISVGFLDDEIEAVSLSNCGWPGSQYPNLILS